MTRDADKHELQMALLEIEWASRKRATAETLEHINTIARAALCGSRSDAASMTNVLSPESGRDIVFSDR